MKKGFKFKICWNLRSLQTTWLLDQVLLDVWLSFFNFVTDILTSFTAKVAYVESWKAIELANSIFGFSGWSSNIVALTNDFTEEIGTGSNLKYRVGATAIIKLTLKDGTFHEDVGYGMCESKIKGTAFENAKKEAVSDARKRALRLFGNALGNSIYDRVYTSSEIKNIVSNKPSPVMSYEGVRKKDNTPETNGSPEPVKYNADKNEVKQTPSSNSTPSSVVSQQSTSTQSSPKKEATKMAEYMMDSTFDEEFFEYEEEDLFAKEKGSVQKKRPLETHNSELSKLQKVTST